MELLKDRLGKLIDESGRSQTELAKHCGVKPPSVNDWVTGETKSLKMRTAIRAADFFGVELMWLTEGKLPMRAAKAYQASTQQANEPAQLYLPDVKLSEQEIIILRAFRHFDAAMKRRWLLVARDELTW